MHGEFTVDKRPGHRQRLSLNGLEGRVEHAVAKKAILPAMHKRGLCRHAVCVCVSVTFVSCVKTNKDIFQIFSPSGSHTILSFPYQTGWR